jgi:methionyl-tRNA formyltransferase
MAGRAGAVFIGSGPFAVPILDALARSHDVRLVGVVTAPPRPAGRDAALQPTPVAKAAADLGVPILTPTRLRDDATVSGLAALGPELIVLADYGRLVPPAVLDLPRHGALNLHPSLLPRHRGAAPIPAAILAGDAETGVSLMRMDEGLDTGPLIATMRLPLRGDEVAPELEARLAGRAADLLLETLPAWLAGRVEARPQSASGATLTRPLRREDGRLDPARPAAALERQVRAYQPWPGSFLDDRGTRLIVWRASASGPPHGDEAARPLGGDETAEQPDGDEAAEPQDGDTAGESLGAIVPDGDALALVTSYGRLRLEEVQPAGRARMSGAAYRRGRR